MTKGLWIRAVAISLLATAAQAQERQALRTHLAATAGSQATGRLPASQQMDVAMTLKLRNQAQLTNLLQRLYDPNSPDYRKFLTVSQFTAQFGPTAADYEAVVNFATAHGLTVTKANAPNRLVVEVSGPVANIEAAFHVNMQVYQHPTENRTYYAPDVEPSVDAGLALSGVSGLNNLHPPSPVSLLRSTAANVTRSNSTGSMGGQYLGSDIRAAYLPGVTLTGTGQTIGLFEFGPYNISDVENYFNTIGQPLNVEIVNVLLNGVSGTCGSGCDDGEEAVDIEQAISMAPGLSAVYVYEGSSDVSILNQMAVDNIAKQLSCSFGWLPADPASDEPLFEEFAAQGQNLFVASGDSGAFTPPSCTQNCNREFYPADDPLVTAVGGTDLTTTGPGGTWVSETAWVGSSGGYSTNGLGIPSYQAAVINSSNHGSTSLRNVPDVAAEANTDNDLCANGGCGGGVGGTSLAAPRWAGVLAIANQQSGGTPIGLLNPTLYAIGQGAGYGAEFHDITSGNNFNADSPQLYSAVPGYDLVTGWGSPQGSALINTLTGSLIGAHTLAPQNAPGLVLDDLYSGTASGNEIDIWGANNTGAQTWVFANASVVPTGFYNVAVSYGAFCMTATGSTSGSIVNLQPCNGSTGQAWGAVTVGQGAYELQSALNTGVCLAVQGDGTGWGTPVVVTTCTEASDEVWSVQ
jgi:subtilase family serine protease